MSDASDEEEEKGQSEVNTFDDLIIGHYEFPDGSLYEGEWNKDGFKHGFGVYTLPDGSVYRGRFERGLPSGIGEIKFPDNSFYVGEFMEGWFNGTGVFQLANGVHFEGQFRAGRIWGLGLTTFADGTHGKPRREGLHRDWLFMQKEKCSEIIKIARSNAFNLGFQLSEPFNRYTFIGVEES